VLAGTLPVRAEAAVELERIATFDDPVAVVQAPGQVENVYAVEQAGRVMVARKRRKRAQPFLDIRDRVRHGPAETWSQEAGMLSIAFDPAYARNRRVYVTYVGNDGDLHLDRFDRSPGSRLRVARGSRRQLLRISHPVYETHYGGQLQFGPDGMLWISVGDGGCCNDPHDQARSLGTLLGKLLRIDPARRHGYRIPPDNPLVGLPGAPEIYVWGLRNPWRFSFDRYGGALLIGDVGDNEEAQEEIDLLPPDRARGANLGWPQYEGHALNDELRPGHGRPVPPVFTYTHDDGSCAVTGGYVVRDPALPTLEGRYLYADFCLGRIRSLVPIVGGGLLGGPPRAHGHRDEGLAVPLPTSFGEGLDGRIYVASLAGPVFRIVERQPGTAAR
ncbi:MAG: PQQ-dependent sugar dehydrogenase, partial [Solirubrobacterales bacterium]